MNAKEPNAGNRTFNRSRTTPPRTHTMDERQVPKGPPGNESKHDPFEAQLVAALGQVAKDRAAESRDRVWQAMLRECQGPKTSRSPGSVLVSWFAIAAGLAILAGFVPLLQRFKAGDAITPEAAGPIAWSHAPFTPVEGGRMPYPLLGDSRLFAYRNDATGVHMEAFDLDSGALSWSRPLTAAGPMVVRGNRLFLLDPDPAQPRIHAFDAQSGQPLWQQTLGDAEYALATRPRMTGDASTLYLAFGNNIVGLAQATGELLWSQALPPASDREMTSGHTGRLFVASDDALMAFSTADGAILWQHRPTSDARGGVPVGIAQDGEHVFLASRHGSGQGRLAAYAASEGSLRWERQTRTPSALTRHEDRLFLRAAGLEAIAADSGTLLWSADIQGCSPATVANHRVFVAGGRQQRSILMLDLHDGSFLNAQPFSGSCSGIVVAGGIGYYVGHNLRLYALSLDSTQNST